MQRKQIIQETAKYIKEKFAVGVAGHDWWHIYRVWNMAKHIAREEKNGDMFVIELAALLHDLGDYKTSVAGEETASQEITAYLSRVSLPEALIGEVITIVQSVSFSRNVHKNNVLSKEAQIVQDADRLDALGAIGIARAFAYGGSKGRQLYDPNMEVKSFTTTEERRMHTGSTINHFHEKLLLLKELMHTPTAKKIAERRQKYIELFLEEFYKEWDGIQ